MNTQLSSWGNILSFESCIRKSLFSTEDFQKNINAKEILQKKILVHGLMRSYGDSSLLHKGLLLDATRMNRFISFNKKTSILEIEAGISLEKILLFSIPKGYFLPVTPGTKFVTLAGAIANDVHGKNHHEVGSFGHFIEEITLIRSNGEILICNKNLNTNLFRATIGGLGLTGFIKSAKIKLLPLESSNINVEHIPFRDLNEFLEIDESTSNSNQWQYTVSWINPLDKLKTSGFYIRGYHTKDKKLKAHSSPSIKIPFLFPKGFINKYNIYLFNYFYSLRNLSSKKYSAHYDSFFYPLDKIQNWNYLYGKNSLLQFQCVIPSFNNNKGIRNILKNLQTSNERPTLIILKRFGKLESIGMMSFPMEGLTICADFINKGETTRNIFYKLFDIVKKYGGRVYPAKDSLMRPSDFASFYPQSNNFSEFIDPRFSSAFWERIQGKK